MIFIGEKKAIIENTNLDNSIEIRFEMKANKLYLLNGETEICINSHWMFFNGITEYLLNSREDFDLIVETSTIKANGEVNDKDCNIHLKLYTDKLSSVKRWYDDNTVPLLFKVFMDSNLVRYPNFIHRRSKLCEIPITALDTSSVNIDLPIKTSLYSYQKQDIVWASTLERSLNKSNQIKKLYGIKSSTYVFKFPNNQIGHFPTYPFKTIKFKDDYVKYQISHHWIGGIIAHEVGLGKTMICIGLILQQHLYKKTNKPTLIITPRRLMNQWETEITSNTTLKVLVIRSIVQYRKLMSSKSMDYNVIIVNYHFLVNDNYLSETELTRLQQIKWNRLILDEGHIYLRTLRKKEDMRIRKELYTFQKNYPRWICSATPYQTIEDYAFVNAFMEFQHCKYSIIKQELPKIKYSFVQSLIESSYPNITRRTLSSVSSEVKIPEPIYLNKFLNFTSIENKIYESAYSYQEKVQLCTHLLVSEYHSKILNGKPLSMDMLRTKYTAYYKDRLIKTKRRIELSESRVHKFIETNDEEFEQKIQKELDLQKEMNGNLIDLNSRLKIFESIEEKINENEICSVCLEEWGKVPRIILHCSHSICNGCYDNLIKYSPKCPICREVIDTSLISCLSTKEGNSGLNEEIEDILKTHGTKMGFLIETIQNVISENENNRIIIFSMWDVMLKLVSKLLSKKKVSNEIVNGTVYSIAKKLNKFRNDNDLKVLMLSADKCASGLNLTEATHIILLDTVNADFDLFDRIEQQAIGRAVRIGQKNIVQIIRFIMKDTIEEDNFNHQRQRLLSM